MMSISMQSPEAELTARSRSATKRSAYLAGLLSLAQSTQPPLPWLQDLRDRAVLQVGEQTFPTTRDEEWRFTDLSALLDVALTNSPVASTPITAEQITQFVLPEANASRLVFINGMYAADLSDRSGLSDTITVGSLNTLPDAAIDRVKSYLGQQPGAAEIFTALNTAGLQDAAVVLVPQNQVIETPIHLLFITTATAATLTQPRALVVAEPNSAVTIVEDFVAVGSEAYLNNSVTEIWLAENAQVEHTRVQREAATAYHIGKTAVSQARTSRYTCHAISLGAAIARHNLEIWQTGEQTETYLNGLTAIGAQQLSDTHSTLALTKPYGMSRQLHKCIVADRAHAVFNGKVDVPKLAQLTDAGQLNRTLLLSPKARVDTKPQLEIVADNVKCSHGATVSQLDADEVFYLQSRGIDTMSAQSLLVYAFAGEILERLPIASLRQTLSESIHFSQSINLS